MLLQMLLTEVMNLCINCLWFQAIPKCDCDCNNQIYHYERTSMPNGELYKSYHIVCDVCGHVYSTEERTGDWMKCECGHEIREHRFIGTSLMCVVVLSSEPWTIFCRCVEFRPSKVSLEKWLNEERRCCQSLVVPRLSCVSRRSGGRSALARPYNG